MKIRRLEIQGFKSFADRTVFDFDAGISAIVGPNGCGKSNVVDALKWVLGDMSARSLRGRKMEDVIFAGCRTRKPLPMAEVALVLDNEDGALPVDHPEVRIARRLHRTGESEYLIQGAAARLRDVRELFLDTGVGTDGNAIMEQGQIDALLAANPQDRRGIFEEAAGVSRYKQRRKEAGQRLDRTRENLARLRDVLDLEEKRLRSLKTQAARARRWQELREELAQKRVARAVWRYRQIAGERSELESHMAAVAAKEAEATAELEMLEQAADEHARRRDAAQAAVLELERTIATAAGDVRAARDRAAWAERSAASLAERQESVERQAALDTDRRAVLLAEVERAREAAREAEARVAADAAAVKEAEAGLLELESSAAGIRDAHDGAKREALEALGRLSDVRNEQAAAQAERRQCEERIVRLREQRGEVERRQATVDAEARELVALTAGLDASTREYAARLAETEEARAAALKDVEAAGRTRAEVGERRAAQVARHEVLLRLRAAREGMDAGARRVLEALESVEADADGARDGIFGIFADLLGPAPEVAAELDLRLGRAAGALVARTTTDALRWLAWLRTHGEGERARFLCLDLAARPNVPGGVDDVPPGALSGLDPRLEGLCRGLLERTALVPDLESGLDVVRQAGRHVVTKSGDRATDSGMILGGRESGALGLVERATEIRGLATSIARDATRLEVAVADLARAEAAVAEHEEQIRRLRLELERHVADRQRRGEALARIERERAHQTEQLAVLEGEHAHLARGAAAAAARLATSAEESQRLEAARASLEERAEEAARGYAAVEGRRREAAERRMRALLAMAETRAQSEAAGRRVFAATAEIEALARRVAGHDEERAALARDLAASRVEATTAEAEARRRDAERSSAGDRLHEARAAFDAGERESRGVLDRRRQVVLLHEQRRDELAAYRLREAELRTRIEGLLEQVQQDHGISLEDVAREGASVHADEAAVGEIEEIQRRIESLGNVNMNAIVELGEVETHVTFLQTQESDMIQATTDLSQAIVELDRISTERFAKVFEEIRESFRQTFRRLFGGGRADILLEDAANVLESGIEIVARPPGKEQRTISLLSGGERTLTAVALLFAVFQTKPSPFAILDEVDAALDEANVRRLLGLLGEFSDRCQFIVITHAKSTMEAADVLYGVTMEEAGVSKKVAVRLADYPVEPVEAAG